VAIAGGNGDGIGGGGGGRGGVGSGDVSGIPGASGYSGVNVEGDGQATEPRSPSPVISTPLMSICAE
jgi:hypothetical protein